MRRLFAAIPGIFLVLAAGAIAAEHDGDWPLHNLDLANGRFSPLTEINTTNAGTLVQKWQLDLPKPVTVGSMMALVVDGNMYLNSGSTLFAVDAATGKTRWTATAAEEFPVGGRGPAFGDGRIYA